MFRTKNEVFYIKNIKQDKEIGSKSIFEPPKVPFFGISGDSHPKYKRVDFESISPRLKPSVKPTCFLLKI